MAEDLQVRGGWSRRSRVEKEGNTLRSKEGKKKKKKKKKGKEKEKRNWKSETRGGPHRSLTEGKWGPAGYKRSNAM